MSGQPQLAKDPLVFWVEDTFRIIGRGRVAAGVILRGTARLSMPVEVCRQGQCWTARIEGVERIRLIDEAKSEREKRGLGPRLGFLLQPQEPEIEANALILESQTVENNPLWAEVTSMEDAQALIALEMRDEA